MSPKVFFAWLVVTIVTVVAAFAVGIGRDTASYDTLSREPVFAELRADPSAAAQIEIESRFDTFTLERDEDGWSTPDRAGYPVDEGDVRRLVAGLSDMKYVERKTSMPERFSRLGLEDIDAELSDSAHVTVKGANGDVLADVIVGRPSARFYAGTSSGTYIRMPGSDETWLVSGVTNVQTRLVPWLDREIVAIPANTVARIEIGEGEAGYVLSREDAEAQFALAEMPEGRSLDTATVDAMAKALASVELEEVKTREDLSLPDDAQVALVTTFDGLNIAIRLAKLDNKYWAQFEASGEGDAASEINARTGNWTYWVPSATFNALTHPREDLLAPKEDGAS